MLAGLENAEDGSAARTAETGVQPPPSDFPITTMSAFTPSWSQAKSLPVRPRPVWISSAMKRTLFLAQISFAFLRNPGEGIRIPASAWMGSTMNAAVIGVMASSRASMSLKGMILNPGVNGPKSAR